MNKIRYESLMGVSKMSQVFMCILCRSCVSCAKYIEEPLGHAIYSLQSVYFHLGPGIFVIVIPAARDGTYIRLFILKGTPPAYGGNARRTKMTS